MNPEILNVNFKNSIQIIQMQTNEILENAIDRMKKEKEKISNRIPKISDNYEELQLELEKTDKAIIHIDREKFEYNSAIEVEKKVIEKLTKNIDIIQSDIQNNKDSLKLKNMGSNLGANSYKGICPTCNQSIEDSLLPSQLGGEVMSIEDNIKHLQSQYEMILFALEGHVKKKRDLKANLEILLSNQFTLRRLAKSLRNDLFAVDEEVSESIVYKKIILESNIEKYSSLIKEISEKTSKLHSLSIQWGKLFDDKKSLTKGNLTEKDLFKISKLEFNFKEYIKAFNYNSASDLSTISISKDTYLPISEGFDMKFDASASDSIRTIWAYTLALLHTSNETEGNHPGVIIFDEPAQHSIVTEDVVNLFNQVNKIPGQSQVILGITINDSDIKDAVSTYEKDKINIIDVGVRSFKKINFDYR